MDKYEHIASLVRKLLDDSLTVEELHELQQLFRFAEAKGEAENWLNNLWESSGFQDNCPADSALILNKLNQKIRFSPQVRPALNSNDGRMRLFVRSLMRYAAVFLLAMIISWFWFGKEKHAEQKIADTTIPVSNSEVSVTYGSKTRIVLPDSSVAFLNSGSRLSYSSVFGGERHVSLTGEGYFIVRSDSLRPFLVHAADVTVKALGTEFNVKAYPEEKFVETVLVSGSVAIFKKGQSKPIIELKPGEKAAYTNAAVSSVQPSANISSSPVKEQPLMLIGVDLKPDVTTGWVNNQLVFDAEPLEQIAVRLERWFNVEINIRNAALKKTLLTARYDTENIEQVMHSLQMAAHFTYQIEKNQIIIK